jgi:peroxiredoxin
MTKRNLLLILAFATISIIACSEKTEYGQPNANFKNLEKDFITWWNYHNNNIVLSSNFIAIDNLSEIITKEDFLEKLTSGDYIPLKLSSKDSLTYYKLFKLDQDSDSEISKQIKINSTAYLIQFKAEGKPFPKFQFVDLNGVVYNNENTKGKIVIIKCWFIACYACVAEFPELNKLVDNNPNRKDIVFISLALDSKEKLNKFLSKKKFNYSVVAKQEDFITKELNINVYPTHLIIDQNGVIRKVVNNADELILALRSKEFSITSDDQISPTTTSK